MDIAKILDLSPSKRQETSSEYNEEIDELSGDLNHIRNELEKAVKTCEEQTRKVDCYSKELDNLQHERLVYFEKLRNLHGDITALESNIKRTEEEQSKEANRARMLMERYGNHLHQVNKLRVKCHLEPLQDYRNTGVINTEIIGKSLHNFNFDYLHRNLFPALGVPPPLFHPFPPGLLNPYSTLHTPRQILTPTSTASHPPPPPPSFRQQPPPMKACLSCHQQIHRNAPICPLCKAKSRSKNPKKQKRKAEEMSE